MAVEIHLSFHYESDVATHNSLTYHHGQLVMPALLVAVSSAVLASVLLQHPRMFVKAHGRVHRMTGLVFLVWIVIGFVQVFTGLCMMESLWSYDIILGVLGTTLALSAAFEFKHKHVRNVASGTLDEHATVTFAEMIEHSFYQGLNLFQIMFLHYMGPDHGQVHRLACVLLVFSSLPHG